MTATSADHPAIAGDASGHEVRDGVAAVAPLLVAFAPFALVIGAAIADHSHRAAGWAATGTVYGGSAQLAVITLLDGGAGLAVVVATALVINLRLLVYGASIAGAWRGTPLRQRLLAAFLLVDPTWLVATQRAARPGRDADRRRHHTAAGLTMWVGWLALVTVGLTVGGRVGGDSLVLAVPLCLVAAVAPALRDPAAVAAVVTAGVTVVAGRGWPVGTGLLAAIVAGAVAGAAVDRRGDWRAARPTDGAAFGAPADAGAAS
jgi:predicted branched-subunit amino acid permease